MNDPIPPRTVWTAVGAIPNIPGPVADIIDELLEACEGMLAAESWDDTAFATGKIEEAVSHAKPVLSRPE